MCGIGFSLAKVGSQVGFWSAKVGFQAAVCYEVAVGARQCWGTAGKGGLLVGQVAESGESNQRFLVGEE